MLKRRIWFGLIGAALASGVAAQQYATIIDNLPTCIGNRNGRVISVSDAVDEADCTVGGAVGDARVVHQCICDTLNVLGPYWKSTAGSGGGLADGDKGDITVASSGAAWTVDANAVALGTDTTGNYAGSASEGGEANTLAPAVVIEGATADGFEGNFAFTDPTADWTWTWGATGAVSGVASITGGTSGSSTLSLDGDSAVAGHIRVSANGTLGGTSGGVLLVASEILTPNVNVGSDWINLRNTGTISWDSAGGVNSGTVYGDTRLVRDYPGGAVGTLAQRSGTQAQTFRIYGTADTDRLIGTNYERLSLTCDGSADCTVAAQTAGTGADDMNLHLSGAGAGAVLVAGCKNWGLLASPPATCDAGNECAEYSDTSHARCYCDGTTWNVLTGSGAGACS